MDLPTCPACGQSVLDDDVDECPFCGASLSGEPSKAGTKPKPTPKPAQSSTKQTPVDKKPAAQASLAEPSATAPKPADKKAEPEADEDDPFEVEKSETGKVIRLHRKPQKGRSHKVICPMCDTAGFTSRKAAGHEVRCPNSDCRLPVFTAPEIKKEEPVEEQTASSAISHPVLIGSGIVGVAVICGAVWFFVFRNQTSPAPSQPSANVIAGGGGGNSQKTTEYGSENSGQKQKNGGEKNVLPTKPFDPVEVREDSLIIMVDLSERLRGTDKARKPLSVRMTAEAFALIGDKQRAENQLKRLDVLGRSFPGYKIPVLSILAWKELNSSRDDAAKTLLDDALVSAGNLKQLGRDPIDAATALATALAAVGRSDEARKVISRHSNHETLGQVSSLLQMMQQSGNYDLDAHITAGPVYPSQAQQWIAVTHGLAVNHRMQESLVWAESHTDLEGRTDCVIVWAETLADDLQAGGLSRIETAAQKLTQTGKARLWARVAGRQLAVRDKSGAKKSLASARGVLESIPIPKPFVLPESGKLYRLGSASNTNTGLPDPAPLRISALAAAEMARVEIRLGQTEQAWKSIQLAMTFARGMAPTVSSIQKKLDTAETLPGSVRGEISRSLNIDIKNRNRLQLVLNRYIKQCERIRDAAEARHHLQTQLLAEAATWGLEEKVWGEIRSRSVHNDLNQKELYYETSVPVILANRFAVSEANDRLKEIQSIFSGGNLQPNAEEEIRQATIRHLAVDAGVKKAATALENKTLDPYVRELWALQMASRLVKGDKIDRAYRFATAMKDPILRENTLMLIAAQATGIGHGEIIWKLIQRGSRHAMDRIALCRGFVAGSVTHASHATSKPSVSPPAN